MSLNILENVSLKSFNTLSIDVKARYCCLIDEYPTLIAALNWAEIQSIKVIVIGGGSNIVLTQNMDALVLIMQTQGITQTHQQDSTVIVDVAAGVIWNDLVQWSVQRGLGGIENLSLIYGTVGAAPVQNIGAYGVEFKDVCCSVQALNRATRELRIFTAEECAFSYRDSFFKHYPEQWIVISVRIKLDYKAPTNIAYAALQSNVPKSLCPLTYAEVSEVVIKTRQQRLPNPLELGNAGSFFKNPIVTEDKAQQLKQDYPDLVTYPYENGRVKLAAGWLIDKAGLKGFREGEVGTYPLQALVLVNYGNATGRNVLSFSQKIQHIVKDKFGVTLEPEPVIL